MLESTWKDKLQSNLEDLMRLQALLVLLMIDGFCNVPELLPELDIEKSISY